MSLFDLLVTILLISMAIALPFLYGRVISGGRKVNLRPLPALDELDTALARAAETGQPVHITPGSGSLHGETISPAMFAGLMLAQRVSSGAARRGGTVTASSGDAVAHLALRGAIHATYRDAGYTEDYDPQSVRLYADHDSLAFAAGVGQRYLYEPMEASVAVGGFGESYLLLGEQGQQAGIQQIAGTTNPSSLAAVILTADQTLYGEEIYVAEAYVAPTPIGLARVLTHDAIRYLLIAVIVVGIILWSLQDLGIINSSFPGVPARQGIVNASTSTSP